MNGQYRPSGFRILPPVVKNLLIINALVFLLQIVFPSTFRIQLEDYLGLHYFQGTDFKPWQFVTYMFLHGSFSHILFNMFALWMFGYALENIWGPRRFLIYYMITGIGAGLVHYAITFFELNPLITEINSFINDPSAAALIDFAKGHQFMISERSGIIYREFQQFSEAFTALQANAGDRQSLQTAVNFMVDYREYVLNMPNVIGASGAVFGILLAFGMLFPNVRIYIYFLFPVKAKYFVIFYGLLELYLGWTDSASNVAHFAHLGGMIFGFFLIKYWKKKGGLY